ncbi:MAG: DNA repair protein RecN [Crocinitomicaceae bacterium]|nr:DNA repair protein RecN [Crocinitomicaceae bacterium]|tara:strand:+ start:109114 stop:110769 length:1656 start_codon:yes stop_codon:yes gene_type:complete
MIKSLSIENFVFIDKLLINFNNDFTVITGETGSGKSILLNSLALVLGKRADFSVVGNLSNKSVVEAIFCIKEFNLEDFFSKHDLDYCNDTIIRREIIKQGKSRAFINDTPVHLNILQEFSSQLINIHSQFHSLELKKSDFQMKVLDVLSGTYKDQEEFSINFSNLIHKKKKLNDLKVELSRSISEFDYNNFQLNELIELELNSHKYDELQNELIELENVDSIRFSYANIIEYFQCDAGIHERLNKLKLLLSKSENFTDHLNLLFDRINSLLIESIDIASEADFTLNKIESNPNRIEVLINLLDRYNRILQKHNKTSQSELIKLQNQLSDFSFHKEELEKNIQELSKEILKEESTLFNLAENLHTKRLESIPEIEKKVLQKLTDLKLGNTVLKFNLTKTNAKELNEYGNSILELLFSPNVGVNPVSIDNAVSGGELSRVMLVLKSLMSSQVNLRSIFFDEIDTGVSGDVAQKMGNMMKKMGKDIQVIAITHLPQVAAKATQHLKVIKFVDNNITKIVVKELSDNERVEEIARLMSGSEIKDVAIDNARVLMK